jgi:hypothetical protein
MIVIDLMGLVNMVLENPCEALCGGRHNIYRLYYEKMLQNLSQHSDLIFFLGKSDGTIQVRSLNHLFDFRWTGS